MNCSLCSKTDQGQVHRFVLTNTNICVVYVWGASSCADLNPV